MPWSYLHITCRAVPEKKNPIQGDFRKIERDVSISWQLRGLRGDYGIYMVLRDIHGCYGVYVESGIFQ